MTSDHRIIQSRLKKIECKNCGLVRSGFQPDIKKLQKEYQKNYEYNIGMHEDMIYFSSDGLQDRSSHTFNRISKLLSNVSLNSIKTIVEVGCGEGNLLQRFQEKFPEKEIIGLEINEQAIKKGRKKGLDIRPLSEHYDLKADLLISYTVIEHTPSPKNFFKSLSQMLNPNGFMILGTPHQDNLFYDIFFVDHLFHFSMKHLQDLARFSNLKLIKKTSGSWPISSIAICLFRLDNKKLKPIIRKRKTKVKQSIVYYNKIFKKIDQFLASTMKNKKLAIFGLGEIYCLFLAYTNLRRKKIIVAIEDFPTKKYNFPIISSKNIQKKSFDTIIFCVNPNYYSILTKRLKLAENSIFLPFKN